MAHRPRVVRHPRTLRVVSTTLKPDADKLIDRAESLLDRLERAFRPAPPVTDWNASIAFRWRRHGSHAAIQPVAHVHRIELDELKGIDDQKRRVEENTLLGVSDLRDVPEPYFFILARA